MKRFITLLFISSLCYYIQAQENDSIMDELSELKKEINAPEDEESTTVSVGDNEVFRVEEKDDTTNITIGDKNIKIIEGKNGTSVKVDKGDGGLMPSFRKNKFRGHWAGFEFGLNNYVNSGFSFSRDPESEFMDINTGRSWNFNLNFAQFSIGLISDRVGLVTGLGLEWSNYHFSNNNNIQKLDGIIAPRPYIEPLIRNKLQTTYITVPLLIEGQMLEGRRSRRLYLAAGVVGGIKLCSRARVRYIQDGEKRREKFKDDFYLSPFRYGVTVRAGYRLVKLYANYYLTPLFLRDRGPELYPVAMGFVISF